MELKRRSIMSLAGALFLGVCMLGVAQAAQCGPAASVSAAGTDVIDTAKLLGPFDTFVNIVENARMSKDLESYGLCTLIAPTDQAFEASPATTKALLDPANRQMARDFVESHLVSGWYIREPVN
jgi:uncharacterized surface protein with fasciclin (FAS1) repeats